jgi:hypothetical protein
MFYPVYGPCVHDYKCYASFHNNIIYFFQTLNFAIQESFCIIFMEDVSLSFVNNNNNNNNNTTLLTVFTINTCKKTVSAVHGSVPIL